MRSFTTEGIVLKRSNAGEADRILTMFTKDFGKMSCVAKGVRKMTSSKRSSLEPGMYSKFFCVRGHGMPILTQAQVIDDFAHTRSSLATTRSLTQILEILDVLTVEEQGQDEVFACAVEILEMLSAEAVGRASVVGRLQKLVELLGFQDMRDTRFETVSEYVEFLSERKLKSFAFLTVNTHKQPIT